VEEIKLEFLLPAALHKRVLEALFASHPYEEVAYELVRLANNDQYSGSGLIGELTEPVEETALLARLKQKFNLKAIRHTRLLNRPVKKIAVCGGAGSFLLREALDKQADVFITSDIKYHEYFDAEDRILLVDIGHYESEQYTIELLANFLQDKNPTFAVLKTETNTNPVQYFV
jgi:putative NIF3 family GTP cyclohydrolase 1 type 2